MKGMRYLPFTVVFCLALQACAGLSPEETNRMQMREGAKLFNAQRYTDAEAAYRQAADNGSIEAIVWLLDFLYSPWSGKIPDPEKYTAYLMRGAVYSGQVSRSDQERISGLQTRLGDAYFSGQDLVHANNGSRQFRWSTLPKDVAKACEWWQKSAGGPHWIESHRPIPRIVENCPEVAAQLGYSAVDEERANKQLEKEFNQFKSKWGNSPEAQAYREREAREREESNRQYEEMERQQERLQMEMLGQAAGMLGQALQGNASSVGAGMSGSGSGNPCGGYDAVKFDDVVYGRNDRVAATKARQQDYDRCMNEYYRSTGLPVPDTSPAATPPRSKPRTAPAGPTTKSHKSTK